MVVVPSVNLTGDGGQTSAFVAIASLVGASEQEWPKELAQQIQILGDTVQYDLKQVVKIAGLQI